MNDTPVVPAVLEKKEPQSIASTKKVMARKQTANGQKVGKKIQHKIVRSSTKKAPVRKVAVKRERKSFPYLRVLKMWQAGKSSMAIAKAIGRYDSKAADPMHGFRVTLTRFHKGVRIDGKIVKLPHRVSKVALKRATKAGKKASA